MGKEAILSRRPTPIHTGTRILLFLSSQVRMDTIRILSRATLKTAVKVTRLIPIPDRQLNHFPRLQIRKILLTRGRGMLPWTVYLQLRWNHPNTVGGLMWSPLKTLMKFEPRFGGEFPVLSTVRKRSAEAVMSMTSCLSRNIRWQVILPW